VGKLSSQLIPWRILWFIPELLSMPDRIMTIQIIYEVYARINLELCGKILYYIKNKGKNRKSTRKKTYDKQKRRCK
jgi:hypothetical protein